jgi:tyrosine-protein kinase Etk/Wzc
MKGERIVLPQVDLGLLFRIPDRQELMETEITHRAIDERSANAPASVAVRNSDEHDEISIFETLLVIAERRYFILQIAAGFALIAVVIAFVLPKRYTATVSLLPPQQGSSLNAVLSSQVGSLGGMAALAGGSLGIKNPNEMFVAMLKSRTVEDAMVQHFELMKEYREKLPSDARKEFEKHATVDGTSKDGLIRISVEDSDPKRAADLANGYVEQFRALSEHLAITEASQRRLFFEKQLEQAKDNLASAEEALKRTQQSTGLIQLDSQARALIESAASLKAQIAAKEGEIQGMQTYATSENAQLIQAQRELDGMRTQLAKLGGSESSVGGEIIVPKGMVPEAGLEYIRKVRDVKYNETIFDILARQFELAKLDEAREGALIQVVDPAIPPDKKSFPRRGLIVLGATAAGFLIGAVIVLFKSEMQKGTTASGTARRIQRLRETLSNRKREVTEPPRRI